MGRSDYHKFRLPYWDWRIEMQNSSIGLSSDDLLTEERFGVTRNVSGYPRVFGFVEGGWNTTCWLQPEIICDPQVNTGPLQRCPFTGTNPCSSSNPDWPSAKDVEDALNFDSYDAPPYTTLAMDGFRSFMDHYFSDDIDACRENRVCQCIPGGPLCPVVNENTSVITATFQLHTMVSL